MQGAGQDRLPAHLSQRPHGAQQGDHEGVQPGTRDVLGVLQLRQDLPDPGSRRARLRGLRAHGRLRGAAALHRHHHVDGQVPQRHGQALQVPHPHHPGRPGGPGRRLGHRSRTSRTPTLFTEPDVASACPTVWTKCRRRRRPWQTSKPSSRNRPADPRRRHGRLRRRGRGRLLGQEARPQGHPGRQGGDGPLRRGGHGPVGHQPVRRPEGRPEHRQGLRRLRPQRPHGRHPRRPRGQHRPPRRLHASTCSRSGACRSGRTRRAPTCTRAAGS